ncbi:MAG TPA: carboxypeptidase regulatory-like domain-containing protein [Vicinamibacterales bacterium]|nr:carboxypeptidase regulatory-like domain-containing protein [Vicinamibacterales bacterium]
MLLAVAVAGLAVMIDTEPAAQEPGSVRGRVSIGIPVTAKRATSTYSRSIPAVALAPESELRHVVVYVKDAPKTAVQPMRAEIRQRNENFVPRVVAVTVGSVVEFPNDDPIYHNVFSLSRAKTFDLGRFPKGKSRGERFDKPGVVKVFCQIHSHMSATVMVFDHPWFAIPDEQGNFDLSGVPPGMHQVTAWHERLGETTLPLRVEPGRPATIDFVLPVPAQP